jgi:hypothetical protein
MCADAPFSPHSYHDRATAISSAIQNTPRTPAQEAADWVEYAIKHDGALFNVLPTYHIPAWKQASLDVYALLAAIVLTLLYVVVIALPRALYRRCLKTKPSAKKAN